MATSVAASLRHRNSKSPADLCGVLHWIHMLHKAEMAIYRRTYEEFEDHVRPQGLQPIEQIRAIAKDFALQKRNYVNDIICRRYYWTYVVNYCITNNMDVPAIFWDNPHDPDGEFTYDIKTKRAAKRSEKKIAEVVQQVHRLHEELTT